MEKIINELQNTIEKTIETKEEFQKNTGNDYKLGRMGFYCQAADTPTLEINILS